MNREVIAVENLSKNFGEVAALRKVSFSFSGPQTIGILGPNGAGKTTLLEIVEGLSTPDEGHIRLFGEPLKKQYPKHKIGVVMQREFVFEGISAEEYAALFSAIYHVKEGQEKILQQAKLSERRKVAVARLSGGEQQRLFIAAAQVHQPTMLFLDEPTAHLDPASKRELWQWIQSITGCTILLTTHDLREADALCSSLLFLVQGEAKAFGAKEDLLAQVPEEKRGNLGIEDAFFHFCASRLTEKGELA